MSHTVSIQPAVRTLCAAVLLFSFVMAPAANAQVLYGSIVGNVTDSTGGAVPGATVTITHSQTQTKREMATDENGGYRFQTIQPGTYKVVAALTGFSTFNRDVDVSPNNVT